MEIGRRAARVGRIAVWSSGCTLQALPLCLKRSGALEAWCAWCACSDVEEAQRFGALEMRCSRRDIEVWPSSVLCVVVVGISSFRSSRLLGQKGLRLPLASPEPRLASSDIEGDPLELGG